jgi:plastocyanin
MDRRLVMLLTLVTVGCGGSSGSTAPTSQTPAGNIPTGGQPPAANVVNVSITEYRFGPQDITIKAGTQVVWTNDGMLAHTVTGNTFASGQLAPPIGGGAYGMTSGQTYTSTFSTPGTYAYHCSNHPSLMTGTVTVTP